jgi:SAM-dependent methyltransferase
MDTTHADHQHGHGHGHDDADWAGWVELLDLDAEVFHAYLADLTGWTRELAGDRPGGQLLDLGCGTGTGTLALARRFETARVTALDGSAELLGRLDDKASQLGLAGRITTRPADLDADWPGIGPGTIDVAWASMSVHHLADPDAALARVRAALRPGGLFVLAETASPFVRFLPDDLGLGRPGLEERCRDALLADVNPEELKFDADWGPRLERAGLAVAGVRPYALRLSAPLPPAARRFAQIWLGRTRARLDGRLDAGDLATLDTLVSDDGPGSVLRRADLIAEADRPAWVARRPAA